MQIFQLGPTLATNERRHDHMACSCKALALAAPRAVVGPWLLTTLSMCAGDDCRCVVAMLMCAPVPVLLSPLQL
jgi:hypothetical protein